MRILLIRPPYTRIRGTGFPAYFPLGIGYLAAVLEKAGFPVRLYNMENPQRKSEAGLLDAEYVFKQRAESQRRYREAIQDNNHLVWKELEETLKHFHPDIIGVSILSVEVASALKVSSICKEWSPACKIVWGGCHPTFLPEESLENGEVDFVIRGEGEKTMVELCKALEREGDIQQINGLSFKETGRIIHNVEQGLIQNLDDIPFPARNLVLYSNSFRPESMGNLILSRGCPWRCTFCSSRNLWQRKVRFRTPENLVREIQEVKERYGIKTFVFWDDALTINRELILNFCQAMIDSKLNISWKAATRADLIDRELLPMMREAGCVQLDIGVETGSERMSRLIKKDVDFQTLKKSIDLINRSGIASSTFFMAGFPQETEEDLEDTFRLMKEINTTYISFNILDPMPGSDLYDTAKELGVVPEKPDWRDFPLWPDNHFIKGVTRERFTQIANKMARWLYHYDNKLTTRWRRARPTVLSLLKGGAIAYLFKKAISFFMRRTKVWLLAKKGAWRA